jgi:hypothetical protein
VRCWFTHLLVLALSFLVKRFLEHGSQAAHASMRCAETLGIRSMVQHGQCDGPCSRTWGLVGWTLFEDVGVMGPGFGIRSLECRILGVQIVERNGIGFFCFLPETRINGRWSFKPCPGSTRMLRNHHKWMRASIYIYGLPCHVE